MTMTITDPLAVSQADLDALKQRYTQAGQGHLFTFWDGLSEEQQSELFRQLNDIDVERVNEIYKKKVSGNTVSAAAALEPLPDHVFDSVHTATPDSIRAWNETGMKLISEGKVAVILMAGGQGTRLGSSAPKGCYDINLPSRKSLFRLQAERILRLQNLAKEMYGVNSKSIIPWYIMTSGPTHEPSYQYFKANKFFGLKEENVTFFQQGKIQHTTVTEASDHTKFDDIGQFLKRHTAMLNYGRENSAGNKASSELLSKVLDTQESYLQANLYFVTRLRLLQMVMVESTKLCIKKE
jgi:UDP-N-acetylglucosamine/UDP-N-acetylgalactosamine diphosphorylase